MGRREKIMLVICIIPIPDLPLICGPVKAEAGSLILEGHKIPCSQGTAAMVSAALAVSTYLDNEPPIALLAGDIGSGAGSRLIYNYIIEHVATLKPRVLAMHYCMPDLKLTVNLCEAVKTMPEKPIMLADAASMYAAKAADIAPQFDMFTPDLSEIAFLADPEAIHPAYINKHLFESDCSKIPLLIEQAYRHKGAAKNLLVKGAVDYIVAEGKIIDEIEAPDVPILECIGGTGDTITGMVAAFADAELELHQAAIISAKANRAAGEYAQVTPANSVSVLINALPQVFKDNLCAWSGVCSL
jgi:NAD(P)H-hydrate repair Nnr-like enzyme with NAD(P)H-hydrate dehydratase domain